MPFAMKTLAELIPEIFLTQLGIHETSKNHGVGIAKYWDATNYPDGYEDRAPYCAAALCWVIQAAMKASGKTYTFVRPRTPAAFGFESWSLQQDNSTWTKKNPGNDIKSGDIVILKISHIEVALTVPDADGWYWSIGANTGATSGNDGDGVYKKRRNISGIRSRIRFRV